MHEPSSSATPSSSSPESKSNDELFELVPGFFEGSSPFFLLLASFLLWSIILPLAVLLPLSYHYTSHSWSLRAAMFTMIGTGLLYFFIATREFPLTLIAHSSDAPPSIAPFAHTTTSPRQSHTVEIKRVLLIVNPYGGGGRNRSRYTDIVAPLLATHHIDVTPVYTTHGGHAREIVHTMNLSPYSAIAVMGGDGTMHEVVNGLLSRPDHAMPPLALLPAGTGNALATDLGTLSLKRATMRLIGGHVCYMDANHIQSVEPHNSECPLDLYSVETITWGLVGNVAVQAELPLARRLGNSKFEVLGVWGVLKHFSANLHINILSTQPAAVTDTTPPTPTQPTQPPPQQQLSGAMVTAYINNTQYFGVNLRGAPRARLDDGLFDLLCLPSASRSLLLALFVLLPPGAHGAVAGVKYVQASSVVLQPQRRRGVLNVDGEIVEYDGPFSIQCKRKLIPLLMEKAWPGRKVPGLKEKQPRSSSAAR